jgi:hypothetical protein
VQDCLKSLPGPALLHADHDLRHAVDHAEQANSSASVTTPISGRAQSTAPNAIEISPVTMSIARVPADSPLWDAAKISAVDRHIAAAFDHPAGGAGGFAWPAFAGLSLRRR